MLAYRSAYGDIACTSQGRFFAPNNRAEEGL